jgi:prepilin-type N-terminal cleavage/methylation domain-containing protein
MQKFGFTKQSERAFTLVELIVVMLVIAIVSGLVSYRGGAFTYWQREGVVRRLSETITFLHHRAVADRVHYRLEFSMPSDKPHSFKVGQAAEIKLPQTPAKDSDPTSDLAAVSAIQSGSGDLQSGQLSQRLADFLTPQSAAGKDLIDPVNFPSLAKPELFPEGLRIRDIKTTRGTTTQSDYSDREKPFISFSPRGFSEFAVIHLALGEDEEAIVTVLVNPFTGLTTVYREDKDFEWTLNREKK